MKGTVGSWVSKLLSLSRGYLSYWHWFLYHYWCIEIYNYLYWSYLKIYLSEMDSSINLLGTSLWYHIWMLPFLEQKLHFLVNCTQWGQDETLSASRVLETFPRFLKNMDPLGMRVQLFGHPGSTIRAQLILLGESIRKIQVHVLSVVLVLS